MLNDNSLEIFILVAEHQNISKAAKLLNLSQPAITAQIQNLEKKLNTQLFIRDGKRISLSASGYKLLPKAQFIVKQYQDINEVFLNHKTSFGQKITLGCNEFIYNNFLPQIIAKFADTHPEILVETVLTESKLLPDLLMDKKIDLAISLNKNSNTNFKSLDSILLKNEKWALVCSTNKGIKPNSILIDNLNFLPFVWFEKGLELDANLCEQLAINEIDLEILKIKQRSSSTQAIVNYVIHSDSFAFLPESCIQSELQNKQLQMIKIKDVELNISYQLIYERGNSFNNIEKFKGIL